MIPSGMRAMAIGFDKIIGTGGLIRPGHRVDVFAIEELNETDSVTGSCVRTHPRRGCGCGRTVAPSARSAGQVRAASSRRSTRAADLHDALLEESRSREAARRPCGRGARHGQQHRPDAAPQRGCSAPRGGQRPGGHDGLGRSPGPGPAADPAGRPGGARGDGQCAQPGLRGAGRQAAAHGDPLPRRRARAPHRRPHPLGHRPTGGREFPAGERPPRERLPHEYHRAAGIPQARVHHHPQVPQRPPGFAVAAGGGIAGRSHGGVAGRQRERTHEHPHLRRDRGRGNNDAERGLGVHSEQRTHHHDRGSAGADAASNRTSWRWKRARRT